MHNVVDFLTLYFSVLSFLYIFCYFYNNQSVNFSVLLKLYELFIEFII